MSSIMPRALPCAVCKTTLVKTGGATGMCRACRDAHPEIADVQRANRKAIAVEGRAWIESISTPVPGKPGLRKVDPNAIFGRKKK